MSEKAKNRGTPVRYKPEYDDQAYKLALLGLTPAELAQFFGVSLTTINNWKSSHPSFRQKLEDGSLPADAEVSYSLYKRAVGYEYKETKVFASSGILFKEEITVHVPADVKAAAIWLMNRQRWRWTLLGQQEREDKAKREEEKVVSEQGRKELSENPVEASRQYMEFMRGGKK